MPRDDRPKDGHIFYQWMTGEGGITHKSAVLKEGYGMMVFCESCPPGQKHPAPTFKLFAHDRGTIIETVDVAEFKRAISQIPAGETLRLFNTCGGGTHPGMEPDTIEGIEDCCRRQGITYVGCVEGIICTCL